MKQGVFACVLIYFHVQINKSYYLKGHSSQFQQGSGIDILTSFSNFYHLFISMREVFPENLNFIAQFSLILWLLKVLGIVPKFPVSKFL